jgi:hypothetical protein
VAAEGLYVDMSPNPRAAKAGEFQATDVDGLGRDVELLGSIGGYSGRGGPISFAGPYGCLESVEPIGADGE